MLLIDRGYAPFMQYSSPTSLGRSDATQIFIFCSVYFNWKNVGHGRRPSSPLWEGGNDLDLYHPGIACRDRLH